MYSITVTVGDKTVSYSAPTIADLINLIKAYATTDR